MFDIAHVTSAVISSITPCSSQITHVRYYYTLSATPNMCALYPADPNVVSLIRLLVTMTYNSSNLLQL